MVELTDEESSARCAIVSMISRTYWMSRSAFRKGSALTALAFMLVTHPGEPDEKSTTPANSLDDR
jgi:hypothetical protein